jgi:hypothetical protein
MVAVGALLVRAAPIVAAESPRSRARNSTRTGSCTLIASSPSSDVMVEARTTGWPNTAPQPSTISATTPARWSRGRGGGSSTRSRDQQSAPSTKESASARIATGAVTSWTSAPASPGPATDTTAPCTASFAFPSRTRARPTRSGRNENVTASPKTASDDAGAAADRRAGDPFRPRRDPDEPLGGPM